MSISVTHVLGISIAGLYDEERIVQGLLAIIPVMIFVQLECGLPDGLVPRLLAW